MITNFCEALATELQELEIPVLSKNLFILDKKEFCEQQTFS